MIDLRHLTPAQIEAYKLALSIENKDLFIDKLERFKEQEYQKFSDSMGSYRASSEEKETFQDLLLEYITYITYTNRSFFGTGCKKQTNGQLEFANRTAYTNFCTWLEKSGIANTKFSNFKREFNDKVRDVIGDQRAQADRNAKKYKRRLKALSGMLIGAALGTATFFGGKAVIEKFQNSEDDDAKTDRIEHRVKVTPPTAQEQGYVQDAYEEVIIQDEVRHQTEEFRQPQQHEIVEEIVEEVAPRRVIQEPDIVIPGKVIQEPDRVIPGKVIQEPDTIVPGRVIHQPDVVVPAQTTYVQPTPTVIQQPTVTVVDNSSPVAEFVSDVAGTVVGNIIYDGIRDNHRDRGGHLKRKTYRPSGGYSGKTGCGPNIGKGHQKRVVKLAPTPGPKRVFGGTANVGRPQAKNNIKLHTPSKGSMNRIMQRGSKHGGFGGKGHGGGFGGKGHGGGFGGKGHGGGHGGRHGGRR